MLCVYIYVTYRGMDSSVLGWLLYKLGFYTHAQSPETENLSLNVEILYKGGFSQARLINQVDWYATYWQILDFSTLPVD